MNSKNSKIIESLEDLKAILKDCGIAVKNKYDNLIIINGEPARLIIHKKNGVRRRVKIKILSRKPINLLKLGFDAKLCSEGIEIMLSKPVNLGDSEKSLLPFLK